MHSSYQHFNVAPKLFRGERREEITTIAIVTKLVRTQEEAEALALC